MMTDDNMAPAADAAGSDDMSSDMPADMAGEAAMPASDAAAEGEGQMDDASAGDDM